MTTSCFFHGWQSRMQNEKYISRILEKSSKVWNFGRQIAKLPQEVLIIEKLLLSTFPLVKRWIWILSTHLQRAYEVAVIVTSWLMMDWVVGSTNLASTKCCYWWCLCLRWLTSPMRDAQSLEKLGKAWYCGLAVGWLQQRVVLHVGLSGRLSGCSPRGVCHRGRSYTILTGSLPRPSDVAGSMLNAFTVVLSTSLYRLRWLPRDRRSSSSSPNVRALRIP